MPLTLAHPAAILPLHQLLSRRAVLSALVVGSMAPDFAYVVPGVPFDAHTPLGLLWFGLPAGWLGYWLWHRLLAGPLLELVPPGLAWRLRPFLGPEHRLPERSAVAVTGSLLAGAATHLVWDAFTHVHGAAVRAWPGLQAEAVRPGGRSVPVFKVLQHGSTVVGLAVLAVWLWRVLRDAPGASAGADSEVGLSATRRWLQVAALVGIPAMVGLVRASELPAGTSLEVQVGAAVFAGLPVGAGVVLVWAIGWWRGSGRSGMTSGGSRLT
ncbi:MAG: DUF4184 family protein [Deltaproteobacteria bacterium]|nr:DUF4184 family protein [Deltaproteobacteria bacterium]